jgi:hypothetical protein
MYQYYLAMDKYDHKCILEIIAVIFPCFYKWKLQFYRNIHLHSLKQFDIRNYFTENWNWNWFSMSDCIIEFGTETENDIWNYNLKPQGFGVLDLNRPQDMDAQ